MSDGNEVLPGTTVVDQGSGVYQDPAAEQIDKDQELSGAMLDKAAEEATTSEQESEKTETATVEPDKFASKFAALSRKEKALRDREAQIDARLAEIEAKAKEQEEKFGKYASLGERLQTEPIKVMEEEGLTYEQLTQMILNDGNPTPEMQIQRLRDEIEGKYTNEVANLRKELEEKEEAQKQAKHEEVIENFMGEITEFVNKDEQYEFIRANNAVNLVYSVIEEYHQETGRILSTKEAADQVESHLEEEAKKFVKLKKIQGMLKPSEPDQEPTEPKSTESSPTLSNTQSSQVPNSAERKLSYEESLQEAAKLIKWDE